MRINKLFSRLSVGALVATAITVAANPAQAASFSKEVNINFDENVGVSLDAKDNPLKAGNSSINELWKDYGLTMSTPKSALWLYESSCKATGNRSESLDGFTNECTGGDNDLATGKGKYKEGGEWIEYDSEAQGKVLIIQETRTKKVGKKRVKGQDRGPDDRRGSDNKIEFQFNDKNGVDFQNIGLLDFDDAGKPKFTFTFLDGTTQDFRFGRDADEKDPMVTLLSQDWEGNAVSGDNSLRNYEFDFSQNVKGLEIHLAGSGAITELNYYRDKSKKLARKVPEPTSILGLVAISGLAASSLKKKRKSSDI